MPAPPERDEARSARDEARFEREEARSSRGDSRSEERVAGPALPAPFEEGPSSGSEEQEDGGTGESGRERRGGRRRGRRRRRGRGGDRLPGEAGSGAGRAAFAGAAELAEGGGDSDDLEIGAEGEPESEIELAEGRRPLERDDEEPAEVAPPEAETRGADLDAEAGDDEPEPEETVAEPAPPEPEEQPRALPRRRRQRATVVVRNDPDAVLAGLVLARDRRSTTSFRVVRQDDLIDYLKGPANDVSDADDLLLVGFTAQPHARETLRIAELFRGRLQWFDHHFWPIEDVEALRNALGSESVLIEEAANPLPLVNEVTERRSRFTDKLVDLSARRLSENDMSRWGYRMVGLIQRMASQAGEYRNLIGPVLAGKPADLPQLDGVYAGEARWVEENDPRLVCFGEYELAVCEVPEDLDAGEVGRRVRAATGARLSLCTRRGDDLVLLGASEEKRPLNVTGLMDQLGSAHAWARARSSADRVGRVWIEDRAGHPERLDALIGEIVRRRSVLHG